MFVACRGLSFVGVARALARTMSGTIRIVLTSNTYDYSRATIQNLGGLVKNPNLHVEVTHKFGEAIGSYGRTALQLVLDGLFCAGAHLFLEAGGDDDYYDKVSDAFRASGAQPRHTYCE